MRTIGGLLLFLALGLITLVGINASSDMLGEAGQSNNTNIQNATAGGASAMTPIWTVLGYAALLGGAMLAIHAFS